MFRYNIVNTYIDLIPIDVRNLLSQIMNILFFEVKRGINCIKLVCQQYHVGSNL